ncbi:MAG TPA: XdhC family protein [Blastocatellia bacterium]|nr:XdhC family protein [Blastocatellia bacterium]
MSSDSQFLAKINRLIEAQEVFILARIISAADQQTIGTRVIVDSKGTILVDREIFSEPQQTLITRKANELLSGNATGVHTLWLRDDTIWDTRKQGALFGVMFEIVRPQPELLICGAGHVGNSTARLGIFLEYKVTVIDERPEFANRQNFPDPQIGVVAKPFDVALREQAITSSTNIVIVTRGHAQDETCLKETISSRAGYIGMIGSKRRVNAVFDRLVQDGIDRSLTDKVHAPIGLRIGARTPEEIAVSILAEIISLRNPQK